MDLLRAGNGPWFWVAVLLLAAGIAMVTGAVVWQMRKVFTRRTPAPAVGAVYDSRREVSDPVMPEAESTKRWDSPGQSINDLAVRLQKAADRLEHIGREFSKGDINSAESLLKHPDDDVEYVFKASTL